VAPELSPIVASFAVRSGRDLVILWAGTDADGDVTAIELQARGADGAPVVALDTDGNRQPDVSTLRLPLPDDADPAAPAGTLVLRAVDVEGLVTIAMVLVDETTRSSTEQVATPTAVPQRAMGEACDAAFLRDRCAPGLGCRGEPASCQEGLAPELTRVAYLTAEEGPRILFEGSEPEDDLATITLEFLDALGNPLQLDLDNDGAPDSGELVLDAAGAAFDGQFFYGIAPAETFVALVPKVAATARDAAGHVGARLEATAAPIPRRSNGQSCDPRGFDACQVGSVCTASRAGQPTTCQSPAGLRTTECNAAVEVVASATEQVVVGAAAGVSLWDPPAGCTANPALGRPEGVFRLKVTAPAAELWLSTNGPGTTFDTVMSLHEDCGAAAPILCGDDSEAGGYSELVLTNVAPGDYLVVVDSYSPEGGAFELHVQTR